MESGVGGARQLGKCMLMCPERERFRRERQKQLSVFETKPSGGDGRYCSSPVLAVKEYVRSAAGQRVPDPHDLRPPSVLVKTTEYLIGKIADRMDHPWHSVYHFIHNRLQSIRQDITYQQLEGSEVIHILMLASRFHLYSQYRLSTAPLDQFDPKLNRDHLQQCLLKLLRTHRLSGTSSSSDSLTEFEAHYLLTNLGSTEALTHTLELPKKTRQHPTLQAALAINLCFLENNFVRVFKLISHLPPLQKCALFPHIQTIRSQALRTLSVAYSSSNAEVPLRILSVWLGFGEDKVGTSRFCRAHGIEVTAASTVLFRKGMFTHPAQEPESPFPIPELSPESQDAQPSHFIFGQQ